MISPSFTKDFSLFVPCIWSVVFCLQFLCLVWFYDYSRLIKWDQKYFHFVYFLCKIVVISPLSKHSMSVTDICRLYISCLCNFLVYKEFHLSCWNCVKKKENPIIFPYYHFYVHSICLCSDVSFLLILIIFAFSLFQSWPILLKLQFDKSFQRISFFHCLWIFYFIDFLSLLFLHLPNLDFSYSVFVVCTLYNINIYTYFS